MSLVLGLLQAVTTDMYGVLLPAEKPVLEENRLRSLLADSRQEINQQEGEQEKGDNASCDIHSFGFQCSRKGFIGESFLLKRPIAKNIFTDAALNEILSCNRLCTQFIAYGWLKYG